MSNKKQFIPKWKIDASIQAQPLNPRESQPVIKPNPQPPKSNDLQPETSSQKISENQNPQPSNKNVQMDIIPQARLNFEESSYEKPIQSSNSDSIFYEKPAIVSIKSSMSDSIFIPQKIEDIHKEDNKEISTQQNIRGVSNTITPAGEIPQMLVTKTIEIKQPAQQEASNANIANGGFCLLGDDDSFNRISAESVVIQPIKNEILSNYLPPISSIILDSPKKKELNLVDFEKIFSKASMAIQNNKLKSNSFPAFLQDFLNKIVFADLEISIDAYQLGKCENYLPISDLMDLSEDFTQEKISLLQEAKLMSFNPLTCKLINPHNFLTMLFLSYLDYCVMIHLPPKFGLLGKKLSDDFFKFFPEGKKEHLDFWLGSGKDSVMSYISLIEKEKLIPSHKLEIFYKMMKNTFQIEELIESGVNLFRIVILNSLLIFPFEKKDFGILEIWECVKFIINPNNPCAIFEEYLNNYFKIQEEMDKPTPETPRVEKIIQKTQFYKNRANVNLEILKFENLKSKVYFQFSHLNKNHFASEEDNFNIVYYSQGCLGTFSPFVEQEEDNSKQTLQRLEQIQTVFQEEYKTHTMSMIEEVAVTFEEMLATYRFQKKDPLQFEQLCEDLRGIHSELTIMKRTRMTKEGMDQSLKSITNIVKNFIHLNPNNPYTKLLEEYFHFWKRKTYKSKRKERDIKNIGIKTKIQKEDSTCNLCYLETNHIKHHQCGHQFCDKCIRKYVRYMTENEVIINFDISIESVKAIKCPISECYYCLSLKEIYLPFQSQMDIVKNNYAEKKDFVLRENKRICHMCKGVKNIIMFSIHHFCGDCIKNYFKYQIPNDEFIKRNYKTFPDFARAFQIVCPVHNCKEFLTSDRLDPMLKEMFNAGEKNSTALALAPKYYQQSISFVLYKTTPILSFSKCKTLMHRELPIVSLIDRTMKSEHPCTYCPSCIKDFERIIKKPNLRVFTCNCCGNLLYMSDFYSFKKHNFDKKIECCEENCQKSEALITVSKSCYLCKNHLEAKRAILETDPLKCNELTFCSKHHTIFPKEFVVEKLYKR